MLLLASSHLLLLFLFLFSLFFPQVFVQIKTGLMVEDIKYLRHPSVTGLIILCRLFFLCLVPFPPPQHQPQTGPLPTRLWRTADCPAPIRNLPRPVAWQRQHAGVPAEQPGLPAGPGRHSGPPLLVDWGLDVACGWGGGQSNGISSAGEAVGVLGLSQCVPCWCFGPPYNGSKGPSSQGFLWLTCGGLWATAEAVVWANCISYRVQSNS